MDHSYSTERERLQRSDHSYFTVGKKTPQVVLRKAQHLREHSLEVAKSSIGQDHSYVRSDRASQTISTSFDGLEALIEAISYRESEADVSNGSQHLSAMEIPACEPQHDLQTCSSELYTSASSRDDVECPQNGQTVTANDPLLVTFRRTDLDDLPCWIGCIQLDHPYDSHMSSSVADNFQTATEPPVDYHHEVAATTGTKEDISGDQNVDPQCWHQLADVRNCWVGLLDHAYESSSWDSGSTGDHGRWDHAYNIQCSADESSSSIGRSVSGQHLDHSYDSRMSSELSCSETVLSSFLDHAYFASDWVVTSGRRCTSGQRWSSTDDLRTVGRATAAFL